MEISLILIGRCGPEQSRWVNSWKKAGMQVEVMGEESVQNISNVFFKSSIGISTTPVQIIGKSGSVAAMLEHGLSVICVQPPWCDGHFEDLVIPKGVIVYKKGNLDLNVIDPPEINDIIEITKTFVKPLLITS